MDYLLDEPNTKLEMAEESESVSEFEDSAIESN